MKPLRYCPICPNCGSKKFKRLEGDAIKVQCLSCQKILDI